MQPSLFDLEAGRRLRDEALEAHEDSSPSFLEQARSIARTICEVRGCVTANDVRRLTDLQCIYPHHPNVWGSLFRGSEWVQTGERVPSAVKRHHASDIRVWRLKGAPS